jgi:hypothetical protein
LRSGIAVFAGCLKREVRLRPFTAELCFLLLRQNGILSLRSIFLQQSWLGHLLSAKISMPPVAGRRRLSSTLWSTCLLFSIVFVFAGLLVKRLPGDLTEAAAKENAFPARFTIADFDGDQKPDLAMVDMGRSNGSATSYSIHLQLSLGPESVIGITAPVGGLQILSRDVNGDRNVDLVVRTSLESNLVAVLLNDGHGKFTVAQNGTFPGLERESELQTFAGAQSFGERISLLPPRSNTGVEPAYILFAKAQIAAEPAVRFEVVDLPSSLMQASFGRSPPLNSTISS